jgi:tetratricopeptide (TPR) repeat protein
MGDIRQAIALHRQGHLREAEQIYATILAAEPAHFDALHLLGLACHQQGRAAEALRLIAAALRSKPDSADALSNYGLALAAFQRHQDALASFDRALALQRDHANALNNRGVTLKAIGRGSEALASWDQALDADPNHAEALYNRGDALHDLKRHAEALADYDRFLASRPNNVNVLNSRGGSLAALGRLAEALDSYERAIALEPDRPELLINKANVLAERHEFDHALSVYAEAAAIGDKCAEANLSASLIRLRRGEFAQGWRDYEWRWRQASWESQRRSFTQPLWLGDEVPAGRTILLHAEQGYGDTIQFARYAVQVAALGATVVLEVQPPLQTLFADLAGVARVIGRGDPLPALDLHCPLMSLPLAFRTSLETVPAGVPYLQAPVDRLASWRERLGAKRSLRVGLVWAGRAEHKNDHNRSIAFARFATLLSIPGIEFISLQKELAPADTALLQAGNVIHLGSDLQDFADTAAVLALLDLVISVDTSVVHLAGAMGRTVWVLLSFTPDFRWLLAREDSPWYPTARLFRQPRHGDWESVLQRVGAELELFAKPGQVRA